MSRIRRSVPELEQHPHLAAGVERLVAGVQRLARAVSRRCRLMTRYPYEDRFPVNRTLPEQGRPREERPRRAAPRWPRRRTRSGRPASAPGTMYCGDHEHYAFMNEAFGLFAHVNALQRDMCPSQTKFEGEIIAMTLDLFHADAVTDTEPVGLVTTGGTGSILHAMLAYREHAAQTRGVTQPERDQARDRAPRVRQGAATSSASRCATRRSTRRRRRSTSTGSPTTSTTTPSRSSARPATTATAPSTRSTSCPTSRCERGVGLHVDGCLGGFILPFGEELGYDIPRLRLPRPGRHEHLGRHPQVRLRVQGHVGAARSATRRCATRSTSSSPAGAAASTARPASRARAPAACSPRPGPRWCTLGREGYRGYAKAIFETADDDAGARCARIPSCGSWATRRSCSASRPTSSTSTTSTTSCGRRGWRFNGQQYPNAIHMAVTRPQTQPGVAEDVRRPTSPTRSPTRRSTRARRRSPARSTAASPAA